MATEPPPGHIETDSIGLEPDREPERRPTVTLWGEAHHQSLEGDLLPAVGRYQGTDSSPEVYRFRFPGQVGGLIMPPSG